MHFTMVRFFLLQHHATVSRVILLLLWYHNKIWLVTYEFSRIIWTSCGYKIVNVLKVISWNFLLLSPEHNLNFYIKCCTNRSMVWELKFLSDIWKLMDSPSMPQDSVTPAIFPIIQIWKNIIWIPNDDTYVLLVPKSS